MFKFKPMMESFLIENFLSKNTKIHSKMFVRFVSKYIDFFFMNENLLFSHYALSFLRVLQKIFFYNFLFLSANITSKRMGLLILFCLNNYE